MAGEVISACIGSVCLLNTTDNFFMDSMVESPSCENGALGGGFYIAYASSFTSSMELSADDVKGMVK